MRSCDRCCDTISPLTTAPISTLQAPMHLVDYPCPIQNAIYNGNRWFFKLRTIKCYTSRLKLIENCEVYVMFQIIFISQKSIGMQLQFYNKVYQFLLFSHSLISLIVCHYIFTISRSILIRFFRCLKFSNCFENLFFSKQK